MMCVVRRSHVIALVTLMGLLMLQPPKPKPSKPLKYQKKSTSTTPRLFPVTSFHPKKKLRNSSHPILTGDMYVPGHSRPHPELCSSLGDKLLILILITSAPQNFTARDAIRKAWGHYAARTDISIAFIIGIPPNYLASAIEEEDMIYGDIITGRFIDSYSNLTLKTLSMLEWVDTYCPRVLRILKTDDDMFINVSKLIHFVMVTVQMRETKKIWGNVITSARVRNKSKYFVSEMQFPGNKYPSYLSGPAYMMTNDVVRNILDAALDEPYLSIEDVFITGVLANKLEINREHVPEFFIHHIVKPAHSCSVQVVIAAKADYYEQFDFWTKMFEDKSKCAALDCSVVDDGSGIVCRMLKSGDNKASTY